MSINPIMPQIDNILNNPECSEEEKTGVIEDCKKLYEAVKTHIINSPQDPDQTLEKLSLELATKVSIINKAVGQDISPLLIVGKVTSSDGKVFPITLAVVQKNDLLSSAMASDISTQDKMDLFRLPQTHSSKIKEYLSYLETQESTPPLSFLKDPAKALSILKTADYLGNTTLTKSLTDQLRQELSQASIQKLTQILYFLKTQYVIPLYDTSKFPKELSQSDQLTQDANNPTKKRKLLPEFSDTIIDQLNTDTRNAPLKDLVENICFLETLCKDYPEDPFLSLEKITTSFFPSKIQQASIGSLSSVFFILPNEKYCISLAARLKDSISCAIKTKINNAVDEQSIARELLSSSLKEVCHAWLFLKTQCKNCPNLHLIEKAIISRLENSRHDEVRTPDDAIFALKTFTTPYQTPKEDNPSTTFFETICMDVLNRSMPKDSEQSVLTFFKNLAEKLKPNEGKIHSLCLKDCPLSNDLLEKLSLLFPCIENLDISSTNSGSQQDSTFLEAIPSLPLNWKNSLVKLDASNRSALKDTSQLEGIPHLMELNLGNTPITSIPKNLPSLKDLHLYYCENIEILGTREELSNLEGLNILGTNIKTLPDGLSKLKKLQVGQSSKITELPKGMTALEKLAADEAPRLCNINSLQECSKLKYLQMSEMPVTRIEFLKECPNLKKLFLNSSSRSLETPDGFKNLEEFVAKSCPELTHLSLGTIYNNILSYYDSNGFDFDND